MFDHFVKLARKGLSYLVLDQSRTPLNSYDEVVGLAKIKNDPSPLFPAVDPWFVVMCYRNY